MPRVIHWQLLQLPLLSLPLYALLLSSLRLMRACVLRRPGDQPMGRASRVLLLLPVVASRFRQKHFQGIILWVLISFPALRQMLVLGTRRVPMDMTTLTTGALSVLLPTVLTRTTVWGPSVFHAQQLRGSGGS